jgi:hypothetical protein
MTDILTPDDFGNRITDAERGHLGPADCEHLRKHDAALRAEVERLKNALGEAHIDLESKDWTAYRDGERQGRTDERADVVQHLSVKLRGQSAPAEFFAAIIEEGLHAKDGGK